MSISLGQITANNCKTAFSLHVVESASDDYMAVWLSGNTLPSISVKVKGKGVYTSS